MSRAFLPKSKKMWAFIGSSSSIAAYVAYDRNQASSIFKETAKKCRLMGNEPVLNDSLVTLKIVTAGMTDEDVRGKMMLFRRYFAKWLTMAGVDYKMTTFTPEEGSTDEESLTNTIHAALQKSDDHIPLDSFTHKILARKSEVRANLGCDLSSTFLERCTGFFNQRKLVNSLSDNVIQILTSK